MAFGTPMSAMATSPEDVIEETTDTEQTEEAEDTATDEGTTTSEEAQKDNSEEGISETADDSAVEETQDDNPSEEIISEGDGDELEYIEAINTKQTDKTPCQINYSLEVPDGFGIPVYAVVESLDTGKLYRLPLYVNNNYTQRCFVPAGNYKVSEVSCAEDNTGTYRFTYPEEFNLSDKGSKDLVSTLSNFDEVDEQIKLINGDVEVKKMELEVQTDFEVKHEGEGEGLVGIVGDQNDEYNIQIKVVKPGILGSASVIYSVNGGETWSEETDIPLRGYFNIYSTDDKGNLADTGLKAYFAADSLNPDTQFIKDEMYTSYTPDPNSEVVYKLDGSGPDAELIAKDDSQHVYDILSGKNISMKVHVLKSGRPGEAVVEISINDGKSYMAEMTVPENGMIEFPELGLILKWDERSSAALQEDSIYSFSAVYNDYTKAIIVGCILAAAVTVLAGMFYSYMKSQLPKSGAWEIYEYKPLAVKSENKPAKKVRKEKIKKAK